MIAFPATPEAFNAYQEQLIGRKQSEKEKEVGAAWVEVFNLSYEDGLAQDRDTLEKDLDTLDKLAERMARHKDNAGVHKFAKACRFWMVEAWRLGAVKAAAQHD